MSAAYAEVILDAHVHYHSGFSRGAFFDAARRNLGAGGDDLGLGGPTASGLLFAESHGVDAFGRFAEEAVGAPNTSGGWCFRETGEDNSLWAVPSAEDTASTEKAAALREGMLVLDRAGTH